MLGRASGAGVKKVPATCPGLDELEAPDGVVVDLAGVGCVGPVERAIPAGALDAPVLRASTEIDADLGLAVFFVDFELQAFRAGREASRDVDLVPVPGDDFDRAEHVLHFDLASGRGGADLVDLDLRGHSSAAKKKDE